MYLITSPWWLRKIYAPGLTWHMPVKDKELFLTFDDGPHPTITPFVLNLLKQYNAKATFFCIGKNVKLYPEVYRQVIDEGHKIGNHTHNHLNGWKTADGDYLKNIMLARETIDSNLFRPPYGCVTRFQAQQLKKLFKIVMWDVLSGDFDTSIEGSKCYNNVVGNVRAGSIIVFHDSDKAFPRLKYALPKVLQYFTKEGYEMKTIK